MASTNKTTNLLLSQFLGTDHFSFLTDYNGDMLKIDTYCGNLKALIDGQTSKTEGNTESIQNIQSDIQSIQSVQERQNKNITDNTNDITTLKEDVLSDGVKIDANTEEINKLKKGSGVVVEIPITRTSSTGISSGVNPKVVYNTNNNTFYLRFESGYGAVSTINGISYVGLIDSSKLPDKVKNILLRSTAIGVCGYVKYLMTQTIDGSSYSSVQTVPLFGEIYSDDGSIDGLTFALSAKTNLPNLDGEVFSGGSYILGGSMTLADRLA